MAVRKHNRRRARIQQNNPPRYKAPPRRLGVRQKRKHTGDTHTSPVSEKPPPKGTPTDVDTPLGPTDLPRDDDTPVEPTAKPEKTFDQAYRRTKSIKQREEESDADYRSRQEKYRTSRGTRARKLLRKSYGKNWGKRIYTDTTSRDRAKLRDKLENFRGREDDITRKISNASKVKEGEELTDEQKANIEALNKKLEKTTAKRKTVGADVREFRGERRAALQKAYEHPTLALRAGQKKESRSFKTRKKGSGASMSVQQQRKGNRVFGGPKDGRPAVGGGRTTLGPTPGRNSTPTKNFGTVKPVTGKVGRYRKRTATR